MSAAIVAAVKTRLDETDLFGGAHDSRPLVAKYPYVVLYADGGIRSSDREADRRVQKTQGFQTVVVGISGDQVRRALDRVVDAIEDWTPTVEGWSCDTVDHEGTQPVRPDETLPDRVLYIATDQWSIVADPA